MNKFKVGDVIVARKKVVDLLTIGKKYLVYEILQGQPVCKWDTTITGFIEEGNFEKVNPVKIEIRKVMI